MRRPHPALPILIACLSVLPGCGGNEARVNGQLLKGGVKYTPPAGHRVTITLLAMEVVDPSGKTVKDFEPYLAILDQESGTFRVPGRDGSGIPPGKYRVSVTQKMTRDAFEATRPKMPIGKNAITRETDYLGDKFGPTTSPIVREIKGPTDLIIDLDKPTGA